MGADTPDSIFIFKATKNITEQSFLFLVTEGTKEDWLQAENMTSLTGNVTIDVLLEELYAYFREPTYPGPESDTLTKDQSIVYETITKKFPDTSLETENVQKKKKGSVNNIL